MKNFLGSLFAFSGVSFSSDLFLSFFSTDFEDFFSSLSGTFSFFSTFLAETGFTFSFFSTFLADTGFTSSFFSTFLAETGFTSSFFSTFLAVTGLTSTFLVETVFTSSFFSTFLTVTGLTSTFLAETGLTSTFLILGVAVDFFSTFLLSRVKEAGFFSSFFCSTSTLPILSFFPSVDLAFTDLVTILTFSSNVLFLGTTVFAFAFVDLAFTSGSFIFSSIITSSSPLSIDTSKN